MPNNNLEELCLNSNFVNTATHYTPEGAKSLGLLFNPFTWEWKWNSESRFIPAQHECTLAFPREVLMGFVDHEVTDKPGKVFAIPYWGRENLDVTLTATRIGYPTLVTDFPVVHCYKKSWNEKRINERRAREPWQDDEMLKSAGDVNPYFLAAQISDVIFAIRHYWATTLDLLKPYRDIPLLAKMIAEKYFKPGYLFADLSIFEVML
jgi:hypothetical protein